MRILAIDPGIDATCCFYQPLASIRSGLRWQFLDLPARGEGAGRRVAAKPLRDAIQRFTPERAFIELVNPMGFGARGRAQGLSSTSRFIGAARAIEAIVECCDVPISLVTPQKWKALHNIPKGADKEASRLLAIELCPEIAHWLQRKRDHGRSESVLLALYGEHCLAPIDAGD